MPSLSAVQAYRKSASHRTLREQEADVFYRVNASLRAACKDKPAAVARAIADDERLWITLMDVLTDPANGLPEETRAAILSVGHAIRREFKSTTPDLAFLIDMNEQIAAGLAGR